MKHETSVVYEPERIARPWGSWCETCKRMIGACVSEADARYVGENHEHWMAVKEQVLSADKSEISR